MIAPLKYSIYGILYHSSEEGIWEYEVYELLKPIYSPRALVKIREILLELKTKAWTDEVETILIGNDLLRKYKLQPRHKEFIEYMLPNSAEFLYEIGIDPKSL